MADQFFNLLRHVDLGHFYFLSRRNKTRDQRIFSSLIRINSLPLKTHPCCCAEFSCRLASADRFFKSQIRVFEKRSLFTISWANKNAVWTIQCIRWNGISRLRISSLCSFLCFYQMDVLKGKKYFQSILCNTIYYKWWNRRSFLIVFKEFI